MILPYRAFVSWVPASRGGRRAPPPGPTYSTMVRFEENPGWPDLAWSVVLRWMRAYNEGRHTYVEIGFLFPDAPQGLMMEGSRFALFEGKKRVAQGIVVPASLSVPDQINEFEAALIG